MTNPAPLDGKALAYVIYTSGSTGQTEGSDGASSAGAFGCLDATTVVQPRGMTGSRLASNQSVSISPSLRYSCAPLLNGGHRG